MSYAGSSKMAWSQSAIALSSLPRSLKVRGAIVVGFLIIGIESDCLVVIGQGPFKIALKPPRFSAPCVSARVAGIETNRRIVVGDSALEITLVHASGGAVEVTDGFVRRETHEHVEIGDRAIELPLVVQC